MLQELEEEFEDKILFGFLEGIWYLDIIYQASKHIKACLELDNCQIQIRPVEYRDAEIPFLRDFV